MKKQKIASNKNLAAIMEEWQRRKEVGDAPDFVETLSDGTIIEVTRIGPPETSGGDDAAPASD